MKKYRDLIIINFARSDVRMARSSRFRPIYIVSSKRGYSVSVAKAKSTSHTPLSLSPSGTLFKTAELPYFKWSTLSENSRIPIVQLLKDTQSINNTLDIGQSRRQMNVLLEDSISQLRNRRNVNVGGMFSVLIVSTFMNPFINLFLLKY